MSVLCFSINISLKECWNQKFLLLALYVPASNLEGRILNFLNFNLKKVLSFLFILSLPLASINMQRKPWAQGWYDQPFSFLASMTQSAFFSFSDGVRSNTQMYLDLINIKKENLKLKSLNNELQSRLEAHGELEKENQR